MKEMIKTFLLVTLIASLIWIWAEGESFSSVVVNPRVSFVTDGTDLEITPDENWRGTVRLRLEGSTVAIKQAEQSLGSALVLKPAQPGVPATPGDRQVVNLVEALRSLPQVRQLGITVVDVDPADTVVDVTKYVERELEIRPEFPLEIELLGEATVIPARVSVRMPEATAATLTEEDRAMVPIAPRDLQAAREETPQTVSGAIVLPGKLTGVRGVELSADQANITFRVRKNVDSVTLASVPVWVAVPPTETSSWDIEVKDMFLRDVVFTGPTDVIRKLRDRTLVPIAEVQLNSDELESGITSKEAKIEGLGAGVDYAAPNRAVGLVIKRRKSNGPAAATEGLSPAVVPAPAPVGGPDDGAERVPAEQDGAGD